MLKKMNSGMVLNNIVNNKLDENLDQIRNIRNLNKATK
jgi:hypothetical protein